MRVEDWLELPDDSALREIVGGELFVAPLPTTRHQRIASNLLFELFSHLRETKRGEVLAAPTGVRLSDLDVVEPDLLVVLIEHAYRVEDAYVVGPPDLVVEILSPGTAGRDLRVKRDLYERSGVPEYWIVDPLRGEVEVLRLEGGAYGRFGLFTRADTLRSAVLPNLALALASVLPEKP